jgi:hypothetical protein
MSYLNPTNNAVPFVLNIHLSEIEYTPGSGTNQGGWEEQYDQMADGWTRDFSNIHVDFKNYFSDASYASGGGDASKNPFLNHFNTESGSDDYTEYLFYMVYKMTDAINKFMSNLMNVNVSMNPNIALIKLLGCAQVTSQNAKNISDLGKISMGFVDAYYNPQSSSAISDNAAAVKTAMVSLFDFLKDPSNGSGDDVSVKIDFLFMRQRFCFLLKISPGAETGIQYDNLLE